MRIDIVKKRVQSKDDRDGRNWWVKGRGEAVETEWDENSTENDTSKWPHRERGTVEKRPRHSVRSLPYAGRTRSTAVASGIIDRLQVSAMDFDSEASQRQNHTTKCNTIRPQGRRRRRESSNSYQYGQFTTSPCHLHPLFRTSRHCELLHLSLIHP